MKCKSLNSWIWNIIINLGEVEIVQYRFNGKNDIKFQKYVSSKLTFIKTWVWYISMIWQNMTNCKKYGTVTLFRYSLCFHNLFIMSHRNPILLFQNHLFYTLFPFFQIKILNGMPIEFSIFVAQFDVDSLYLWSRLNFALRKRQNISQHKPALTVQVHISGVENPPNCDFLL